MTMVKLIYQGCRGLLILSIQAENKFLILILFCFNNVVSVLPKQDSSRIVDLLAPFHEQICQMTHEDWVASKPVNPLAPFNGEATNTKTNEDWYTKWRPTTTSRSEDNDESSKGLLSPYFEVF